MHDILQGSLVTRYIRSRPGFLVNQSTNLYMTSQSLTYAQSINQDGNVVCFEKTSDTLPEGTEVS
jgi:hypothetical protein